VKTRTVDDPLQRVTVGHVGVTLVGNTRFHKGHVKLLCSLSAEAEPREGQAMNEAHHESGEETIIKGLDP
jgi:hypothetical protein